MEKTMTFNFSVWTGPSTVDEVAKRTGFNAGTEKVYGSVESDSRESAYVTVRAVFAAAGLEGYGQHLYMREVL